MRYAFNEDVVACYGTNLKSDYKEKINAFSHCYHELKISVTPKVHAVFHHVSEFCEIVQMGLGPWSEQTNESLHSDFNTKWRDYKVKETEHDDYGERLKGAVIAYNNSQRL